MLDQNSVRSRHGGIGLDGFDGVFCQSIAVRWEFDKGKPHAKIVEVICDKWRIELKTDG